MKASAVATDAAVGEGGTSFAVPPAGLLARTLVMLAALLLAACQSAKPPLEEGQPVMASVTGVAMYLQRIGLPPDTNVVVQLVDASSPEAAKPVIGEHLLVNVPQLPVRFQIDFDLRKIDPAHTYVVQVIVENRGRMLFLNRGIYPVLTRGFPAQVEVLVDDAPQ